MSALPRDRCDNSLTATSSADPSRHRRAVDPTVGVASQKGITIDNLARPLDGLAHRLDRAEIPTGCRHHRGIPAKIRLDIRRNMPDTTNPHQVKRSDALSVKVGFLNGSGTHQRQCINPALLHLAINDA